MNFNALWGNRETEMEEYQKQKLKTKLSTYTIISKLCEKSEVNTIKIHIYPEDGKKENEHYNHDTFWPLNIFRVDRTP